MGELIKMGQRVGVGWHGGHCGQCVPCLRGDFISCQDLSITGFSADDGYAQYMISSSDTWAFIPDAVSPIAVALALKDSLGKRRGGGPRLPVPAGVHPIERRGRWLRRRR